MPLEKKVVRWQGNDLTEGQRLVKEVIEKWQQDNPDLTILSADEAHSMNVDKDWNCTCEVLVTIHYE